MEVDGRDTCEYSNGIWIFWECKKVGYWGGPFSSAHFVSPRSQTSEVINPKSSIVEINSPRHSKRICTCTQAQVTIPYYTSYDRKFMGKVSANRWDEMRWGEMRWDSRVTNDQSPQPNGSANSPGHGNCKISSLLLPWRANSEAKKFPLSLPRHHERTVWYLFALRTVYNNGYVTIGWNMNMVYFC